MSDKVMDTNHMFQYLTSKTHNMSMSMFNQSINVAFWPKVKDPNSNTRGPQYSFTIDYIRGMMLSDKLKGLFNANPGTKVYMGLRIWDRNLENGKGGYVMDARIYFSKSEDGVYTMELSAAKGFTDEMTFLSNGATTFGPEPMSRVERSQWAFKAFIKQMESLLEHRQFDEKAKPKGNGGGGFNKTSNFSNTQQQSTNTDFKPSEVSGVNHSF